MEMLLARVSGMTFTTAAVRSRRAAEAGVAGRLSRSCRGVRVWRGGIPGEVRPGQERAKRAGQGEPCSSCLLHAQLQAAQGTLHSCRDTSRSAANPMAPLQTSPPQTGESARRCTAAAGLPPGQSPSKVCWAAQGGRAYRQLRRHTTAPAERRTAVCMHRCLDAPRSTAQAASSHRERGQRIKAKTVVQAPAASPCSTKRPAAWGQTNVNEHYLKDTHKNSPSTCSFSLLQ